MPLQSTSICIRYIILNFRNDIKYFFFLVKRLKVLMKNWFLCGLNFHVEINVGLVSGSHFQNEVLHSMYTHHDPVTTSRVLLLHTEIAISRLNQAQMWLWLMRNMKYAAEFGIVLEITCTYLSESTAIIQYMISPVIHTFHATFQTLLWSYRHWWRRCVIRHLVPLMSHSTSTNKYKRLARYFSYLKCGRWIKHRNFWIYSPNARITNTSSPDSGIVKLRKALLINCIGTL